MVLAKDRVVRRATEHGVFIQAAIDRVVTTDGVILGLQVGREELGEMHQCGVPNDHVSTIVSKEQVSDPTTDDHVARITAFDRVSTTRTGVKRLNTDDVTTDPACHPLVADEHVFISFPVDAVGPETSEGEVLIFSAVDHVVVIGLELARPHSSRLKSGVRVRVPSEISVITDEDVVLSAAFQHVLIEAAEEEVISRVAGDAVLAALTRRVCPNGDHTTRCKALRLAEVAEEEVVAFVATDYVRVDAAERHVRTFVAMDNIRGPDRRIYGACGTQTASQALSTTVTQEDVVARVALEDIGIESPDEDVVVCVAKHMVDVRTDGVVSVLEQRRSELPAVDLLIRVLAIVSDQEVITGVSGECVTVSATKQRVVPSVAAEQVRTADPSVHRSRAGEGAVGVLDPGVIAMDDVFTIAAFGHVCAVAGDDDVVA